MPSSTERQREFMGAELARKRAGKKTKTGMNEQQLHDFASKPLAKSIDDFIEKNEHTPDMPTNQGVFKEAQKRVQINAPKYSEAAQGPPSKIPAYASDKTRKRTLSEHKKYLAEKRVNKGDKGKAIGAAIGRYLGDKAEDALMRTKTAQKIKNFIKVKKELPNIADDVGSPASGQVVKEKNGKMIKQKIDHLCKSIKKYNGGKK